MKHEFNPYDLNDVANVDKFIKEYEQEELRKLAHVPHTRPTEGILKLDDPRKSAGDSS